MYYVQIKVAGNKQTSISDYSYNLLLHSKQFYTHSPLVEVLLATFMSEQWSHFSNLWDLQ